MAKVESLPCPGCAHVVRPGKYEGVEIGRCESCNGTLLRQPDLELLLRRMTTRLDAHIDADAPIEPHKREGPSATCPRCSRAMERFGYMGTNLVFLDTCGECFLLWLAPEDLSVMSLLFARTQRRNAELNEAFADVAQEWRRREPMPYYAGNRQFGLSQTIAQDLASEFVVGTVSWVLSMLG